MDNSGLSPDRVGASALAIMYHEVLADGAVARGSADAVIYKIGEKEFCENLRAIGQAIGNKVIGRVDDARVWAGGVPVFLTFDDGEASAHTIVADALEEFGWRGHFFVTTDAIGQPGFLNRAQIRDLHERGHVIGSHSCSHPRRISALGWDDLVREWRESARVLSEITGDAVTIGSVPGGFYTRRVGRAAAQAGLRILFTSEPTMRTRFLDGCLVLGRYHIQDGMGAAVAGAFAAGRPWPRWKQAFAWKLKKAAKATVGPVYAAARQHVLTGRAGVSDKKPEARSEKREE